MGHGRHHLIKLTVALRFQRTISLVHIMDYFSLLSLYIANAPDSDRKDLLSELELMKKLKPHPHVIKLVACVTESGKRINIPSGVLLRRFSSCIM